MQSPMNRDKALFLYSLSLDDLVFPKSLGVKLSKQEEFVTDCSRVNGKH